MMPQNILMKIPIPAGYPRVYPATGSLTHTHTNTDVNVCVDTKLTHKHKVSETIIYDQKLDLR